VNLESVPANAFSKDDYAPLYQTVLQRACAAHLRTFEAVLHPTSVVWVDAVLAAATGIKSLGLFVVGDPCLLLEIQSPLVVTQLVLSLNRAQVTTNEPLAPLTLFLAGFLDLRTLVLEFFPHYACPPSHWLAQALRGLRSGCLHTLRLDGGTEAQEELVEAIMEFQPNLTTLAVSLRRLEPRQQELLRRFVGLETCHVDSSKWTDLKFLELLLNLRTVHIWVDQPAHQDGVVLRLPRAVTEFICACRFLPHVILPEGLQSLVVSVGLESAAGLVALLPTLSKLHSLSLRLSGGKQEARQTQALIEKETYVCASVRSLKLKAFATGSGLSWILRNFLDLRELEFEGWQSSGDRDRELVHTFALCSGLQHVVDERLGSVVTISRRQDGRLVKRQGCSRTFL
jgi:hypothetical protein